MAELAAFLSAVRAGDEAGVQQGIHAGLVNKLDTGGWTALAWATWDQNMKPAIVQMLLAAGGRHCTGWTPLHGAVQRNNATVVEMLLAAGADAAAMDHQGWTPFDWATWNRGTTRSIRRMLQSALGLPLAAAVNIVVNGLEGPRCSIDASTDWTILEVQEAISLKLGIPVTSQRLINGTKKLGWEVVVSSLIAGEPREPLQLTLVVEPPRPVEFVGMRNGLEQVEPGHLRKTGGVVNFAFNARAVSAESFVVGQGRGLRFRLGTTDKSFMIGLGSRSTAPTDFEEIEYAALWEGHAALWERHGYFYVYESGAVKYGSWPDSRPSIVELRVTEAQVEFLLDGEVKYTSQLGRQQRLYATAAFRCVGGEALDIQWL